MHKAIIRRTQFGRRLVAVTDEVAAGMVARGEAVPVNSRLLREVIPDSAEPTYETRVMTPAKPGRPRKVRT
jgi:hypothetical protein